MVQIGINDHFGQNDLIPNWILAFARPKWTKMVHFGPIWPGEVHFGPFRSANRTPGKKSACAPLGRKNLCCESRFYTGGRGLSVMIRANRVIRANQKFECSRFDRRIGLTRYKNRGFNCE